MVEMVIIAISPPHTPKVEMDMGLARFHLEHLFQLVQ